MTPCSCHGCQPTCFSVLPILQVTSMAAPAVRRKLSRPARTEEPWSHIIIMDPGVMGFPARYAKPCTSSPACASPGLFSLFHVFAL